MKFKLVTTKIVTLTLVTIVVIIASAVIDPVGQNPEYHQFADQRIYLDIPNALNVLSGLFFVLVGVAGLYLLCIRKSLLVIEPVYLIYLTFFSALIAIAPGSAYYHWAPDNHSLVWDRLPMTVAFTSFFSIIIAERLSLRLAKIAFLPLLITGVLSIVYWYQGELSGQGDLRPYALVQFLPMLLIPMILLMFKAKFTGDTAIWWFLFAYLTAKGFEALDQQIFDALLIISGHSLKHLAASMGCYIFLSYLHSRTTIDSGLPTGRVNPVNNLN